MKTKICALTSVSGPYIKARYSEFLDEFSDFDLTLIEFGKVSKTYAWEHDSCPPNYRRVILSEKPAETLSFFQLSSSILAILSEIQPDLVVIAGYSRPSMLVGLVWCLSNRKPSVLLSESKVDDASRYRWREYIKRLIIKAYKSALVGGQPQKRYLLTLGKSPESIFTGYNVVGNDTFHPGKIRQLASPIPKPYFLTVNRFVPKKNLLLLLDAYADYRQIAGENAQDLVLSGDGPLRTLLEQKIQDLGIQDVVHLPGFLQQQELLPYFAHASCFIHTSTQEQWGLVVNEAMSSGLPVIVSNRCGCFEDLVIEGDNGFGFDPENPQQLTELMVKMSSDSIARSAMGQTALQHIQNFSPVQFAQGLKQAIDYALKHY